MVADTRNELAQEAAELKEAINQNDLAAVQRIMLKNPALHGAPIGYAQAGPLTWVAECRVPRAKPDKTRLAMAEWMIDNGSDVHQDGDAPLMRAALDGERVPMMELLVSRGADVNAAWHGNYPILFAPCETLDAVALEWLLGHGADPNCGNNGFALDYLTGSYLRQPEVLTECVELIMKAGGKWKHDVPAVMAVITGRVDQLGRMLLEDPGLIDRRFPSLDFGTTAARMLTLRGCGLLHVAAEFQRLDVAEFLVARGADVNAKAMSDSDGVGGQTPIFHAATQREDAGLPIVTLLASCGADLMIRAKLPGHYENPGEVVECTPLGYALMFPGCRGPTSEYLMKAGAAA